MATEGALDKTSASVPSSSETEIQLNRQQDGGSMVGVEGDVKHSDASQEEIVQARSINPVFEGSRNEDHRRAIQEIEEFASKPKTDEITISRDRRLSLPPAVEVFLDRLQSSSSNDPMREFRREYMQGSGFGTLFGGSKDPDFDEEFGQKRKVWVEEVRLLVMTAVGKCKTLEIIDASGLNLTIQELKALLEPMQSSSILRKLSVHQNGIVNTKEGCKVVSDFLKLNRSLKALRMSIEVQENFNLRHNPILYGHSTLETLSLDGVRLKKKDIAGMVRSCPNLQDMPCTRWEVEDDQTAEFYAQVLIEHKSFCCIAVRGPAGPVSSLLLSACCGARSATSLIGLCVEITGSDRRLQRKIIPSVIRANRKLGNISFRSVATFSDEWQEIFRNLRHFTVLKSLALETQSLDGLDGSAWEELVLTLEEGTQPETLHISKGGEYQQPNLCPLIEAVTSHFMTQFSLKNFDIHVEESKALARLIEKNRWMTKLELMYLNGCHWEELFSSLRHNTTLKSLNVRVNETLDDRALLALVAALKKNSVLEEINLYDTNWVFEGKDEIVHRALQEKEGTYAFVSTSTEDKIGVFRSLQQDGVVQHLYLSFMASDSEFDERTWKAFKTLAEGSWGLQSLIIFNKYGKGSEHNLVRLFAIVSSNKWLLTLTLRDVHISGNESEALAGLLRDNRSLTKLTLVGVMGVHWEEFFKSLHSNHALQTLELRGIQTLDDGAFQELQSALQVNSSLIMIDLGATNWQAEGKDVIIRSTLEQKRRRETEEDSLAQLNEPSRPYFILCDGPIKWTDLIDRIKAVVNNGIVLTLHLMCEARSGCHNVAGQPGVKLTLRRERSIIPASIVQASLVLASLVSDFVPGFGSELSKPESGKVVECRMMDSAHESDATTGIPREFWEYVKEFISVAGCAKYFKLYRGRYVTGPPETRNAWLCKECLERGRRTTAVIPMDE